MNEQQRKWMLAPLIMAALGIPYAVVDGGVWQMLTSWTKSQPTSGDVSTLDGTGLLGAGNHAGNVPVGIAPTLASPTARLEGPPVQDLAEVIRFDISPGFVSQHWTRVSTTTAELELEGLRVPLVTARAPDDLAGSLTYYFDRNHTLQRLSFHGVTGDERRLVTLLSKVYGFKQQPSLGGGLYVTMWNGRPTSALRITYAPVVKATTPNAQKEVLLEINRPGEYYSLSPEMRRLLERDQHVRRW